MEAKEDTEMIWLKGWGAWLGGTVCLALGLAHLQGVSIAGSHFMSAFFVTLAVYVVSGAVAGHFWGDERWPSRLDLGRSMILSGSVAAAVGLSVLVFGRIP